MSNSMSIALPKGTFVGRVWNPAVNGPSVVALLDGNLLDITSETVPTISALFELDDPIQYINQHQQNVKNLGKLDELNVSDLSENENSLKLLAPCDLQAIKACGVTFAHSMFERIIEEKALGEPKKAAEVRNMIHEIVGDSLQNIVPGSAAAEEIKIALQQEGMWSQYLEVGIGPYAEVFTKSQPLSAVGHGAEIGIHPESSWNNPEPEIILAVNSKGKIVGATLGNDVNLRDFEGRSALLLGKAKDNNASCAIGPFIRLFDDNYSLDDVRESEVYLEVIGKDGFRMKGHSSMNQISRDPLDLVAQTISPNHQYPDGLMLFLGTLFSPVQDRHEPGSGFTHEIGDVVTISNPLLGGLTNTVNHSDACTPWMFGISALMKNLSKRKLI